MLNRSVVVFLSACFALSACSDDPEEAAQQQTIRGLKTVVVKDQTATTLRKYPGVLQPSTISTLSFEISGKLAKLDLEVGQKVKSGDLLARLDPTALKLQVDSSNAALERARSAEKTTREDFERKNQLLKQGVIARSVADQAENAATSAKADLIQAQKSLDTAQDNLTKAELRAPFDGIINSVSVDSFTNISPGTAITSVYSAQAFEVSFSVNYEIVNLLVVGKAAEVRLADDPSVVLDAHVSEVGSRADTVAAFPVVISLDDQHESLKAGMAVEITIEFPVAENPGYPLPLTTLILEGDIKRPQERAKAGTAHVFVFDETSGTVKRREIKIGGIRENALIVIGGLNPGERVASAGVSFLTEGQKVKPLPDVNQE